MWARPTTKTANGMLATRPENSISSTGQNGRHPLPPPEAWAKTKARLGIDSKILVVAYDKQGSIFASRLWWMLKATGHAHVQVMDGGLDAWNGPIGIKPRLPTPLAQVGEPMPYVGLVTANQVLERLNISLEVDLALASR